MEPNVQNKLTKYQQTHGEQTESYQRGREKIGDWVKNMKRLREKLIDRQQQGDYQTGKGMQGKLEESNERVNGDKRKLDLWWCMQNTIYR